MVNQRGYSILELMMVVCVIGVLTMVAMTEYNKIHNRAYVGAAMNDLQILRRALTMYDAEWGVFPTEAAATPAALAAMLIDPVGQPYIDEPTDHNFAQFQYQPPADLYGDYTLVIVCNDHWRTQITVHSSQDMTIFRLNA